jgi:hypothetical protein
MGWQPIVCLSIRVRSPRNYRVLLWTVPGTVLLVLVLVLVLTGAVAEAKRSSFASTTMTIHQKGLKSRLVSFPVFNQWLII